MDVPDIMNVPDVTDIVDVMDVIDVMDDGKKLFVGMQETNMRSI
jgi:hypothetical protein